MKDKLLIIWPRHIYTTRVNGQLMCAKGARAWFARHGLNWGDFVAHGIAAEEVLATHDELARLVVKTAKKEVNNGQQ